MEFVGTNRKKPNFFCWLQGGRNLLAGHTLQSSVFTWDRFLARESVGSLAKLCLDACIHQPKNAAWCTRPRNVVNVELVLGGSSPSTPLVGTWLSHQSICAHPQAARRSSDASSAIQQQLLHDRLGELQV
jgi:hypothetical protein